ncbi:MAG: lycopene cyclase domain-containing protein [Chloroflexota bacterium]
MGNLTYLFLILIWSLPIIVIQWLVGPDILLKRWKVLLPGIVLPTLYLTVVDAIALGAHTWTINPTQSLNMFIPVIHVPIEEATFFLCTNTMIVQGLIFLWSPEIRQRMRALILMARRGPKRRDSDSGE